MNQKIGLFAIFGAVVIVAIALFLTVRTNDDGAHINMTIESQLQQQEQQMQEIDTSNWQTYRNEEYGFEIEHPSSWVIQENRKQENCTHACHEFVLNFERERDELIKGKVLLPTFNLWVNKADDLEDPIITGKREQLGAHSFRVRTQRDELLAEYVRTFTIRDNNHIYIFNVFNNDQDFEQREIYKVFIRIIESFSIVKA